MRKFLFLAAAQRFGDFTLLLLRVVVGLIFVLSALDALEHAQAMTSIAHDFARHGLPSPTLLSPIVVYAFAAIGAGLIAGLFTRWAGILCAVLFAFDAVFEFHSGMKAVFVPATFIVIGLYLATHGAGRFSIDAALRANELPRTNGGVRLRK